MKLKNGEIRIYYKTDVGEIDSDLDMAIEKALADHGYRSKGASGFNLTTDVRSMLFEKKGGQTV